MTAHHSVLIFEVLETASLPEMDDDWEPGEDAHELVKELYDIWDNLSQRSMLEPWHDAQQIREEALDLFQSWHRRLEYARADRETLLEYLPRN